MRNWSCNDPKLVLGSYVKGPNNKICRAWAERLGLGHRTVVSHGAHSSLHEGELSVSNKTFPPAQPERLQSLDLVRGVSCSYCSPFLGFNNLGDDMSPTSLNCFSFLFILAFTLPPTSMCRFNVPGLILVPSAHTQSGWVGCKS